MGKQDVWVKFRLRMENGVAGLHLFPCEDQPSFCSDLSAPPVHYMKV